MEEDITKSTYPNGGSPNVTEAAVTSQDPQWDKTRALFELFSRRLTIGAAPTLNHQAGPFCVHQFFADGTHERVRQDVDAETAVLAAKHYCQCAGGTTVRVIITDADGFCAFDWHRGVGIVWPRDAPPLAP